MRLAVTWAGARCYSCAHLLTRTHTEQNVFLVVNTSLQTVNGQALPQLGWPYILKLTCWVRGEMRQLWSESEPGLTEWVRLDRLR